MGLWYLFGKLTLNLLDLSTLFNLVNFFIDYARVFLYYECIRYQALYNMMILNNKQLIYVGWDGNTKGGVK